MAKKAWEGRFKEKPNKEVEEFTASISFDHRLYHYDIMGSKAYCEALTKAGIITPEEKKVIIQALTEIEEEIKGGKFSFTAAGEDIHMHIEGRLIEKVGDIGGKLHTGRSRNDQVALDLRLFLRNEVLLIEGLIKGLQQSLVELAEVHQDVIMPGYTHLQKAQPILFAHHLMAYYEMFKRDRERLTDLLKRIEVLPLGSGALAGTPYPIDREYLAKALDLPVISKNSIDAVSDRDFVAEFIFCCAMIMMHASRISEEFIIWSTPEFGFLRLPETFCTGSSIMPQKANPDCLELIRGKTGRVYGALSTILTVLKGLPLAYNRDLQEDKEPLFDTCDTVKAALQILRSIIDGVEVNKERMRQAASEGYTNATDLADYLVKKGLPFRQAHQITGRVVAYAEQKGVVLEALTLEELQGFSPLFERDVFDYIRIENSVAHRHSVGGTAPVRVAEQIKKAKEELS